MFASPEELAADRGLSVEQKAELLRLWAYDAAESEVATEEGMPGGDDGLLSRILLALESLIGAAGARDTGPTKHHALLTGSASTSPR